MSTQQIHSMISREHRLLAKIHLGPGHCLDYGFGSVARNNTISKDYGISNHGIDDQRARKNMSIAPASDLAYDNETMSTGMKSNHLGSLCNHILRYNLVLLNFLFLKVLISISKLFNERASGEYSNQQRLSSLETFRLERNYKSTGIHDFPMKHSASMHLELQQPEDLTVWSTSISHRNLSSFARSISFKPVGFSSHSIISSDNHCSNYIRARISTIASTFIHSSRLAFTRQSISGIRFPAEKLIPCEIIYPAENILWSIHKKFAQSSWLEQIRFHFSRPSITSRGYLLHFQSKRFSF